MFSDSVYGVKASANLYFLVESAKAIGLRPCGYLRGSLRHCRKLNLWRTSKTAYHGLKKTPRRRDCYDPAKTAQSFRTQDSGTERGGLVHPLIAYADLVATGDPRNLDTAKRLREKYLR
ncbi:type IV toxin-antitoxin system AbiEi family antitoxin [Haliea sp.]|uniref:type IV toxin-antitoxin system AbiEi family antitoxin n=1 Tax=Haliea sp. TaxID=1932666 RepID=UPI0032EF0EC4